MPWAYGLYGGFTTGTASERAAKQSEALSQPRPTPPHSPSPKLPGGLRQVEETDDVQSSAWKIFRVCSQKPLRRLGSPLGFPTAWSAIQGEARQHKRLESSASRWDRVGRVRGSGFHRVARDSGCGAGPLNSELLARVSLWMVFAFPG